jgi:hypothetical protein
MTTSMTTVRRAAHRVTRSAFSAIAALALAAGCSNAVAGVPTGASTGASADPPPQCEPVALAATLPSTGSEQVLRIGSVSPWSPQWTQQESVIIYSDGTAVAPAVRSTGDQAREPAPSTQQEPSDSSTGSDGRAIRPLSGGWIDRCELAKLLHRAAALGRADTGRVNNVMDASTATVWVAEGEHRPEISLSVYALGMGDDDNSDLTADQEVARRELSAWISEVRGSVHQTGMLPLDRILLHETTAAPRQLGTPGPPVSWRGVVPKPTRHAGHSEPCQLLTGAAAADAVRNADRSRAARPDHDSTVWPVYWGEFTVNGSSRHFGLTAVAPGQDCR